MSNAQVSLPVKLGDHARLAGRTEKDLLPVERLGWLLVGSQRRSLCPGGRRLRDAKWLYPTAGRLYGGARINMEAIFSAPDRAARVPPPRIAKGCKKKLKEVSARMALTQQRWGLRCVLMCP